MSKDSQSSRGGLRPGGTDGGGLMFLLGGALLATVCAWLFFDSVRLESRTGWIGGMMGRGRGGGGGAGGGGGGTVSYAIIFLPFFISIVGLFYDASKKWPWILFFVSLLLLIIEFMSGLRPRVNIKSSHLLLMIGGFAAGIALVLRSLRDFSRSGAAEGDPDRLAEPEDRTYLEAPAAPKERKGRGD